MMRHASRTSRRRRGTILIIVMWLVLALVAMALKFGNAMMLEYRAAGNMVSGLQAQYAVDGCARYVEFILENLVEDGALPDESEYETEEIAIGDALAWLVRDQLSDDETEGYGIVDEASKLNLNTATLEMLEDLPNMTPELAAAIVDWRDEDADPTPLGAEASNYLLLDPPYNCKDAGFETVEELRLILDADLDVLFGEDLNLNGVLDPNENDGGESEPPDNADGVLDRGILSYVTVWSRSPNTSAEGEQRVNITQAEFEELVQALGGLLGEERAQQILAPIRQQLGQMRSVLEFYVRSGMTPDEFAQVADLITTSDDSVLVGLVNVATAGADVLACLPGVDESTAESIVAYREGKTSEELASIAWLVDAVDPELAVEMGPYVTTQSSMFSADIAAVGVNARGHRRTFYVFNLTDGEAEIVYRRDRTRMGWALGTELRDSLLEDIQESKS